MRQEEIRPTEKCQSLSNHSCELSKTARGSVHHTIQPTHASEFSSTPLQFPLLVVVVFQISCRFYFHHCHYGLVKEMSEEDPQVLAYQHMILALMLNNPNILNTLIQNNFNTLMENNLNALIQNMQNMANSPSVPTPEDPPESETKENISSMLKELEEHESTPSPTHAPRRTSTGKIDRRMIGKGGARRVEANARERNRVQMLSKKFDELRICLPMEDDAKVSKLATLKVAAAYIGFLGAVLKDDEKEEDTFREILLAEMESAKTVRK
ncbi:hypothetical protein L3Y34_008806 [Caenorhabditis briggsae]|uniref:BHLH domain-containing protein n=1 Tax=Caenorhabditis briggsae TaxID=6238 RepID=A0AAE9A6M5_CAEBR|nr:hypothetical protein L3Y34_008806 [Caenorhabditis briggsae]